MSIAAALVRAPEWPGSPQKASLQNANLQPTPLLSEFWNRLELETLVVGSALCTCSAALGSLSMLGSWGWRGKESPKPSSCSNRDLYHVGLGGGAALPCFPPSYTHWSLRQWCASAMTEEPWRSSASHSCQAVRLHAPSMACSVVECFALCSCGCQFPSIHPLPLSPFSLCCSIYFSPSCRLDWIHCIRNGKQFIVIQSSFLSLFSPPTFPRLLLETLAGS